MMRQNHISYKIFLFGTLFLVSHTVMATQDLSDPFPANKQPQLAFAIYPNPWEQGPLYIQCPSDNPKQISIYNVMGELIYQQITQEDQIDLPGLETGIYLIQVTQDQKTGIQRLVVK